MPYTHRSLPIWTWGLILATAGGAWADPPPVAPGRLRPHVEFLAAPECEGRGTPAGKERARKYLIEQYRQLGLKPLFGGEFEQAIPGAKGTDGSASVLGHNVGAVLRGGDPQLVEEIVLLTAHYDHLGVRDGVVYPGADDNASSVAMVLETARLLTGAAAPPRRTVAFVHFDLEERFLWGSEWFAAHPPWPLERVKLFITADLLGRSLGDLPLPLVFVMGSEHSPELRALLDGTKTPAELELARLGTDMVGLRSDYGPFQRRKVPYLFFSTGEHPDYHTPRDTPDKIHYEQLGRITACIADLVRRAADADDTPRWKDAEPAGVEEARALHRVTALVLDRGEALSDLQRFLVTQVHQRTAQIVARGSVTPQERAWLVRSAQAMLLSVF